MFIHTKTGPIIYLSAPFFLSLFGKMEPYSYFSRAPGPSLPYPSPSSSASFQLPPQLGEGSDQWTFDENKRFEISLAEVDLGAPDLFENLQTRVPEKTLCQIKKHFEELFEDIEKIEMGIIPIPDYNTTTTHVKSNPSSQPRKKGTTWTEEEHQLFLEGLQKYGKGDWKSISRHCVVSKNPTQVASHAQKYFLRLRNSAESQQNANGGNPSDENTGMQNHAEMGKRRKYKKRGQAQGKRVAQVD